MVKNPFMHYVQDLEKEAEDFLRKYECADAIDTPRCIPSYTICGCRYFKCWQSQ